MVKAQLRNVLKFIQHNSIKKSLLSWYVDYDRLEGISGRDGLLNVTRLTFIIDIS